MHTVINPFASAWLALKTRAPHGGVERLDRVLVLNLDDRADRLRSFTEGARRLGLHAARFPAIQDEVGIIGCTLSHIAMLRTMITEGWQAVMICEDDAVFRVSRDKLDVLVDAFLDDDGAEVACLAYHLQCAPAPRSLLYFRARNTRTTACYLVKRSIVADLLAVLEEGVPELRRGGDRMIYGVDMIWKRLQGQRVFLVPTVRAVVQADGWSDIENRHVSYGV